MSEYSQSGKAVILVILLHNEWHLLQVEVRFHYKLMFCTFSNVGDVTKAIRPLCKLAVKPCGYSQ